MLVFSQDSGNSESQKECVNGTPQTGVTLKIHVLAVKHQAMKSDEILCRSACWHYEQDFSSRVERVVSGSPKGVDICPVRRSVTVRRL